MKNIAKQESDSRHDTTWTQQRSEMGIVKIIAIYSELKDCLKLKVTNFRCDLMRCSLFGGFSLLALCFVWRLKVCWAFVLRQIWFVNLRLCNVELRSMCASSSWIADKQMQYVPGKRLKENWEALRIAISLSNTKMVSFTQARKLLYELN